MACRCPRTWRSSAPCAPSRTSSWSGSARAERYGPVRLSAERQEKRRAAGLAPLPTLAVLTNSLAIDNADPLLRAAPLLLTHRAAARPVPGAEVVPCGADAVDLANALALLRTRGFAHVLCEGGPTLFAALVHAGLVDELCLTVSPVLAGP
ncbi:MAG: dihydrofolate reductase family protein, partial [Mycobacteriales bacterium]